MSKYLTYVIEKYNTKIKNYTFFILFLRKVHDPKLGGEEDLNVLRINVV